MEYFLFRQVTVAVTVKEPKEKEYELLILRLYFYLTQTLFSIFSLSGKLTIRHDSSFYLRSIKQDIE